MACVIPGTRSTGFLFLDYQHTTQALPHRTHVRLNSVADPLDPITMFNEADDWAATVQPAVNGNISITGWGTQSPTGTLLLQSAFLTAIVGTHSTPSGSEDYKARTVTIVGRGTPGAPTFCKGQAMSRMFVGSTYNFVPGQKRIVRGVDTDLDNLADFLEANSVIFFDFYGQKAHPQPYFPTQFHAYIQRRYGQ